MRRIVIYNEKGGVGKTCLSIHVAYALAVFHKKKVLLVDLDRQGSSTFPFTAVNQTPDTPEGVYCRSSKNTDTVAELFVDPDSDPQASIHKAATGAGSFPVKNLYIMPSHSERISYGEFLTNKAKDRLTRFHNQLTKIDGDFDYAIIDCSPTVDSVCNDNAVFAADKVVMPIDRSIFSAMGIQTTLNRFVSLRDAELEKNILLVKSKVDNRKSITNEYSEQVTASVKAMFAKSVIRESTPIEQAVYRGLTVFEDNPKSIGCKDYKDFTKELMRFCNG
jgi:chromosome partitioning protein